MQIYLSLSNARKVNAWTVKCNMMLRKMQQNDTFM